jgi:hypothetical protein
MKTFNAFLNESSLSRVLQHTKERNVGMITAHRGENTAEENKKHNKELEHHIRKAGYGLVHVKGRYVENHGTPQAKNVDEHSFLVVGKKGHDHGQLLHHLKKWGEHYKQDSILHKSHDDEHAHLHGTKEGGWPGKGKSHNVGHFHPNRAGEFHTAMKGKRTFAFEETDLTDNTGAWENIRFTVSPTGPLNRTESEF